MTNLNLDATQATHLGMAQMLLETLQRLNLVDPDNERGLNTFYAADNTYLVRTGAHAELSPYAHVQAALMTALTALMDGDAEAAGELYEEIVSNGESVLFNLKAAAAERAAADAEAEHYAELDRQCGGTYVTRGVDPYGTSCDLDGGHEGPHEGPHPLIDDLRQRWTGGGSVAGDPVPAHIVTD